MGSVSSGNQTWLAGKSLTHAGLGLGKSGSSIGGFPTSDVQLIPSPNINHPIIWFSSMLSNSLLKHGLLAGGV
jgi:hypothetical protein